MSWTIYDANGRPITTTSTIGVRTTLNVKDYGAAGDNTIDDLTALTNAINAANAAGVSGRGVDLFFPAGVYKHSAQLPYLQNNVMLVGSGWQSTILMATFTTGDIVRIGNGTGHSGSGLQHMSVWCSGARTTGASIDVNHCDNVLIQNFVINECFQGILVQGASIKVNIDQGQINNVGVTTGVGIQVTNGLAGDTYIRAVVMTAGHAAAAGIAITQSGHFELINCNVSGTQFGTGLLINPTTSQDVSYGFVEHCLFDSCLSFGMQINPTVAASARVRSLTFIDSWFSGCTGAASQGIQITLGGGGIVDDLNFIGCRVLNNQGIGVSLLGATATNISFTDCDIAGNSAGASGTLDGIALAANVSNFQAMNCQIGQAGTAGNTQRYAVSVAAGTSGNIQLINNNCQPNNTIGTHGYINIGALTGGNINISGNTPQLDSGMGSATVGPSGSLTNAETVISAAFRLGANAFKPQTVVAIRFAGSCTVTSAAAVPGKFIIKMGTAGTTGDAAIMTFTLPTSGGVGTSVFDGEIQLVCRTAGASGTFAGSMRVQQASATLGLLSTIAAALAGVAAAGSTVANNYLTLTFGNTGSANVACTFQIVSIEVSVP